MPWITGTEFRDMEFPDRQIGIISSDYHESISLLNNLKTILLIWLSAAIVVGPASYLSLRYLQDNVHSDALVRSIIISIVAAFVSTLIRFPPGRN